MRRALPEVRFSEHRSTIMWTSLVLCLVSCTYSCSKCEFVSCGEVVHVRVQDVNGNPIDAFQATITSGGSSPLTIICPDGPTATQDGYTCEPGGVVLGNLVDGAIIDAQTPDDSLVGSATEASATIEHSGCCPGRALDLVLQPAS